MQKERTAIRRDAAAYLKPVFKRRERASKTKDFDGHSVHQRGHVQRGEPRPAAREECAEDDPGDVGVSEVGRAALILEQDAAAAATS